jgi:secondary thiamine-phosphate synthase enzyme
MTDDPVTAAARFGHVRRIGKGSNDALTMRQPSLGSALTLMTFTVRTERQSQLVDITSEVRAAVAGERGSAVLVYVPHTTAGVTINEHADPMVARDFETALERIVPADWTWQHVEEGEENAPTHIRASFMGPSVLVPLRDDGTMALGTWQGIFFCEFDGPRERSVHVSVLA